MDSQLSGVVLVALPFLIAISGLKATLQLTKAAQIMTPLQLLCVPPAKRVPYS